MGIQVPNSFIQQYERDHVDAFQQKGSYLRDTVRFRTGVIGKSDTFQLIGKGAATKKGRNGEVVPMNLDHTPVTCTLEDFYAGDGADTVDLSRLSIDERMAIAQAGASALGVKVDNQIINSLDGTTSAASNWVQTSSATVRNSMLNFCKSLFQNDVPNDGNIFALLTPAAWSAALTVKEFANAEWVTAQGLPFTRGVADGRKFADWNGVKWKMHTGLTGVGTATATNYIYHRNAVGYAAGALANNSAESDVVRADITWQGLRQEYFIVHVMLGGSCLIDSTGVVKGSFDDTANLPTT